MEIRWSSLPPPGQGPKNSNSVIKSIDGGSGFWFFGGGNPPPGVAGTRIDGSYASPVGPGGYPQPNYAVYDLRDTGILPGHTYSYRAKYRPDLPSINTAVVTVTAGNCGGPVATPTPTPTATPPPAGSGRISGTCTWVGGHPQVNLRWSQFPPPNQGPANSNGLQKGDSYPNDPNSYWAFLPTSATQFAYTDTDIRPDTQYQYRVKYRPDLASLNTYNIFTSAQNCGGPPPTPGPLVLRPTFQNVPPNVSALLSAEGGDGTYEWTAQEGTILGAGPDVAAVFTNGTTQPLTRTVTVRSGQQEAAATVQVDAIQTYLDDIDFVGGAEQYVVINADAPSTDSRNVTLTLAHGFSSIASSSVAMRISNTLAGVQTARTMPFQANIPWDLCAGLPACGEGLYAVYVVFTPPSGLSLSVVLDTITLFNYTGAGSVLIEDGAATTPNRTVQLTLDQPFGDGAAADEITMQLANDPGGVTTAPMLQYARTYPGWDLCTGDGASCPNGTRAVYARFCLQGTCTAAAQDDILLDSPWPDWGVRINFGDPVTADKNVQLLLNPWFQRTGTDVRIATLQDLSDAITVPWAELVPWDLCYGKAADCPFGDYTVYVQYVNHEQTAWPDPESPRYEDAVTYAATTPSPTPAAVLIEGGAAATASRVVRVSFAHPFGASAIVRMRPINENSLTDRDRKVIADEFGGGIDSQPPPVQRLLDTGDGAPGTARNTAVGGTTRQVVTDDAVLPPAFAKSFTELESGMVRAFAPEVRGWDLCEGAAECPYGTYRIFVQFAAAPGSVGSAGTRAALGDEVSGVYFDSIEYAAVTPTPTLSVTPTPTATVGPSGSPGPVGSPGGSPGPGGGPGTGPGGLPSWVPGFIAAIVDALARAESAIGLLAIASAIAVLASALVTLVPLLGSAGASAVSFAWEWFMGALGLLPARKKTWGTVYDSATKRPIPFAKVQLLDRHRRLLETRIADKEGRYGFLTTPESLLAQNVQISILPVAKGYAFPSHAPTTVDRLVYGNLYRGDLITVDERTLIDFDIPMDPLQPSAAPLITTSPSIAMGAATAALADAGFWIGLIMVPLSFLVNPNPFTFGTLCLFLGTASLRLFGLTEHPFGTVSDAQTGRAMPFALMTLNDLAGKRVAFAVSDEQGRYFIVAEKGTYELIVYTPATVQPPRQAKQTITMRKGWLTRGVTL